MERLFYLYIYYPTIYQIIIPITKINVKSEMTTSFNFHFFVIEFLSLHLILRLIFAIVYLDIQSNFTFLVNFLNIIFFLTRINIENNYFVFSIWIYGKRHAFAFYSFFFHSEQDKVNTNMDIKCILCGI